jgi:hypothetical protein
LLHDVTEDCEHKYDAKKLADEIGDDITNIDLDVSKDNSIEGWWAKNEAYLARIQATEDLRALEVCTADKESNSTQTLKDYAKIGDEVWTFFHAGKEDQKWWYRSVLEILQTSIPDNMLVATLRENVDLLNKIT